MTTTATVSQSEKDFYDSYSEQVAKFGLLNVFEEREDRVLYRNIERTLFGKVQYANPIKTWTNGKVTQVNRKNIIPWTDEELNYIADLYLQHVSPENGSDAAAVILTEFRKYFDTHSDDAVEIAVRSFVRLDSHYPSVGRTPTRRYYEIMESKCPGRFMTPEDANDLYS